MCFSCVFFWGKTLLKRVQKLCSSVAKVVLIGCFFFKIVFVAGAKRGGLEVDVCVEELIWSGEVVWHRVIL